MLVDDVRSCSANEVLTRKSVFLLALVFKSGSLFLNLVLNECIIVVENLAIPSFTAYIKNTFAFLGLLCVGCFLLGLVPHLYFVEGTLVIGSFVDILLSLLLSLCNLGVLAGFLGRQVLFRCCRRSGTLKHRHDVFFVVIGEGQRVYPSALIAHFLLLFLEAR